MKKLLTFLVVAAALCSQAASISWTITQVKSSASSSAAGEEYLGLFFIVDTTSQPAVTIDSITKLLDDGDAAGAAALAAYTGETNSSGMISKTKLGTYAAGTSVTAFSVILDAKTAANAKNYIVTGTLTRTAGTTGAMSFSFGSQAENTTYKSVGPVPEPATGALALAGIALLFRRRKA